MTQTLTNDMTVKVPIQQLWEAFKDLHHLLPRLLPGYIDSSTIVEGPVVGGGVAMGSVRDCRFSAEVPNISWSQEMIDTVDDENHIFAYKVTDGEILKKFSSFRVKWQFTPQVAGAGTDVNWTAEFVPLKEDEAIAEKVGKLPKDNIYRDSALLLIKQLESHLNVTGEYSQPSPKDRLRDDLLFN